MKKILLLFVLCAAATAFCALAFVNNVAAVAQWWSAFLAAGGDSSSVAAKMPGIIPWLSWSAVDYSAVTTFIPTLGFLCMTVSLLRMLAGRRARAGDFPFFRGSDQLNVALGLFGTLWGIIVIGYFRLDTVTMADLMQCLHTALFSTLMAVVWVFLVDRPLVRPLFTRLLERSGLAETDEGDLSAAVEVREAPEGVRGGRRAPPRGAAGEVRAAPGRVRARLRRPSEGVRRVLPPPHRRA